MLQLHGNTSILVALVLKLACIRTARCVNSTLASPALSLFRSVQHTGWPLSLQKLTPVQQVNCVEIYMQKMCTEVQHTGWASSHCKTYT